MAQLAYVASCEWWRKSGGFTNPSLTTRHWNGGGENILIESSTALNSGQVVAKVVPLVVALDFLHSFHCMESMTKKVAKYWAHYILSFISILSNETIIPVTFHIFIFCISQIPTKPYWQEVDTISPRKSKLRWTFLRKWNSPTKCGIRKYLKRRKKKAPQPLFIGCLHWNIRNM